MTFISTIRRMLSQARCHHEWHQVSSERYTVHDDGIKTGEVTIAVHLCHCGKTKLMASDRTPKDVVLPTGGHYEQD
jgi:hypothetical protein